MKQRALSLLLSIALIFALLPATLTTANADDTYTVTFSVPAGIVAPSPVTVTAGSSFSLPTGITAPAEGYTFAGWYADPIQNEVALTDDATIYTSLYCPTASTTLYALYQRTETIPGYYEKTQGEPSSSGAKYLIVYDGGEGNQIAFDGSKGTTQSTLNSSPNYVSVTINNDQILSTNMDEYAFTIRRTATDEFVIIAPSGKYCGAYGANDTKIKVSDSELINYIDFDAEGYVVITDNANYTVKKDRILSYNSPNSTIKFYRVASNLFLYQKIASRVITYYTTNPLGETTCTHENTTLTGYVAATCTADGYTGDEVCENCGATLQIGSVIPALGHSYDTATDNFDGTHIFTCSLCGYIESEAHLFIDNVCSCGAFERYTHYVKTTTLQDGDEVIIYLPGTHEAIDSENSDSVCPSFFIETISSDIDPAFVWTVEINGDRYGFTNGNHRLSSYAIDDAQVGIDEHENEYSKWVAIPCITTYPVSGSGDYWTADRIDDTSQFYLRTTVGCYCYAIDDVLKTTAQIGPVEFYKRVDEDLKINTASLTLYEDIVVNFTATVPEGLTNPYMVVELGEQSYTLAPSREDDQGRLVFEFLNLTPDKMGDNIKATLYAYCDGTLVEYCKPEYSVKQYCTNVMAAYPDNQKLQTLLADMLLYGAATQQFTGHNADNPVTDGLDLSAASSFADLTSTDFTRTGTADDNIQWTGAGLECGSQMSMYFTLNTTAGAATSVEVTINGRTTVYTYDDLAVVDESDFGATCRVVFRGISASEYGDVVTAILKNNGEQVGQTLTYSVNSYVYSKQNDTAVENLAQLVKAIYNYGKSAKDYLN